MPDFVSFRSLKLSNWQQFASIEIEFHPTLTVITGANGAGKTTILNLLSRHLGAVRPHFSIPRRDKSGAVTYVTGRLSSFWLRLVRKDREPQNQVAHQSSRKVFRRRRWITGQAR